ncbi:MAG: AAA family ATPase, partial [Acidobacteria bacterium]
MSQTNTEPEEAVQNLDDMTPRQIVQELDKYVVGQRRAKRAVSVALRNRIRRQKLDPEMAEEVQPKNIIMIGSTGVGKTEIARRLARLANSPFIKIEASKFTEVGYVGRDVESLIRDLAEISVEMVRQEKAAQVEEKAEKHAEERLLDLLLPPNKKSRKRNGSKEQNPQEGDELKKAREKLRQQLRAGKLDSRMVELEVPDRGFPSFEIVSSQGMEE